MRSFKALAWWSAFFSVGISFQAQSGEPECSLVRPMLNSMASRQLFYLLSDGTYQELNLTAPSNLKGSTRFIYVAREFLQEGRSGALIVKTGRRLAAGEREPVSNRKLVQLRRPWSADADQCDADLPRYHGSTSAREYDRYHDYGYAQSESEDGKAITSFHASYNYRQKACATRTDDDLGAWGWPSNRSQFSFDPNVVSNGFHSQILAGLTPESLHAEGSVGLMDQHVILLKYRTNQEKIACIGFRAAPAGNNFFLRINDLEGSSQSGRRLLREKEISLELPY
jgi:hypothetical protein